MGYKAEEEIGALDYDFAPYAPELKGITPEPAHELIKQYWLSHQAMVRRSQRDLQEWSDRLDAIKADDESTKEQARVRQEREALDEEYGRWQSESADKRKDNRAKMLAMVCSDQPSYEDLMSLPGRVFDNFEGYMQEELGPKGPRNALN